MNVLTNLNLFLNELLNAKAHILATEPEAGHAGRFYYNSGTKKFGYDDGEKWVYITLPSELQASLDKYILKTQMGVANGVATLGADGKVPSAQLPSYVDDVLEYDSFSDFPTTGEAGKIYVALDSGKTYRWGGTAYAEISASLAIGTTEGTAYDGAAGAALAAAITILQGYFSNGVANNADKLDGHDSTYFGTKNEQDALAERVDDLESGVTTTITGTLSAGQTSKVISHTFNSRNVIVQTYDANTGEQVMTDVVRQADSVTITVAQAYTNDINIVIMK